MKRKSKHSAKATTSVVHLIFTPDKEKEITIGYEADWVSLLWKDQLIPHQHSETILKLEPGQHEIILSAERLRRLHISGNNCAYIGFLNCTNLIFLSCHANELRELDLRECKNLRTLYCSYNNITSLDLSANKQLATLHCNDNRIKTLNISGLKYLKNLKCSMNNLSSLPIIDDCKSLRFLDISYNPVKPHQITDLIEHLPTNELQNSILVSNLPRFVIKGTETAIQKGWKFENTWCI